MDAHISYSFAMHHSNIPALAASFEQLKSLDRRVEDDKTFIGLWRQVINFQAHFAVEGLPVMYWHRARKCEKGASFNNVQELIYRPDGCGSYGRAQVPGSKVLYASASEHAALDEIGAKVGDLVQLSMLRLIPGRTLKFTVLGELARYHATKTFLMITGKAAKVTEKYFNSNPSRYVEALFIDSAIAELFREAVALDQPWQYKATATYAEHFLRSDAGFTYPSVKNFNNINLALQGDIFDRDFEVLRTTYARIREAPGFSIYSYEVLRTTDSFGADGAVHWDDDGTQAWRNLAATYQTPS